MIFMISCKYIKFLIYIHTLQSSYIYSLIYQNNCSKYSRIFLYLRTMFPSINDSYSFSQAEKATPFRKRTSTAFEDYNSHTFQTNSIHNFSQHQGHMRDKTHSLFLDMQSNSNKKNILKPKRCRNISVVKNKPQLFKSFSNKKQMLQSKILAEEENPSKINSSLPQETSLKKYSYQRNSLQEEIGRFRQWIRRKRYKTLETQESPRTSIRTLKKNTKQNKDKSEKTFRNDQYHDDQSSSLGYQVYFEKETDEEAHSTNSISYYREQRNKLLSLFKKIDKQYSFNDTCKCCKKNKIIHQNLKKVCLQRLRKRNIKDLQNQILENSQSQKKKYVQISPQVLEYLQCETYFYKKIKQKQRNKKRKGKDFSSEQSELSNENQETEEYNIIFPELGKVQSVMKKYKPLTKYVHIPELFKGNNFYKQYQPNQGIEQFYFGQHDHERNRSGKGVLVTKSKILQGIWENGYIKKGVQLQKKFQYQGSFKNNQKQGHGIIQWTNGQTYDGQWKNNKRNGTGVWVSTKGQKYEGQWSNGNVNGKGIFSNKLNEVYFGQFKNFLKHGKGQQKFSNGDVYEGHYQQGIPHGKGTYKWHNGVNYNGNFNTGVRQGKGVLQKQKIFMLNGQFKNEKADGFCILRCFDGNVYSGRFKNGKIEQNL